MARLVNRPPRCDPRRSRPLPFSRAPAEALFCAGFMYDFGIRETGLGVEKDDAEAVRLCAQAAIQGHPGEQSHLAKMHETGRGLAKDSAEAVRLYQLAANQGYADAQLSLGKLYSEGRGVAKDDARATHLYQRAAEQGNAGALTALAMMYEEGSASPRMRRKPSASTAMLQRKATWTPKLPWPASASP